MERDGEWAADKGLGKREEEGEKEEKLGETSDKEKWGRGDIFALLGKTEVALHQRVTKTPPKPRNECEDDLVT